LIVSIKCCREKSKKQEVLPSAIVTHTVGQTAQAASLGYGDELSELNLDCIEEE